MDANRFLWLEKRGLNGKISLLNSEKNNVPLSRYLVGTIATIEMPVSKLAED